MLFSFPESRNLEKLLLAFKRELCNLQGANAWFMNLDKLIDYINNQLVEENVHLLYSTPSCYLKSLREANVLEWPSKEGDFFPYASDYHAYWTGYYRWVHPKVHIPRKKWVRSRRKITPMA